MIFAFGCHVPGGDIVLSMTEGIVISIIGLLDGIPLTASLQDISISSILQSRRKEQKLTPKPIEPNLYSKINHKKCKL